MGVPSFIRVGFCVKSHGVKGHLRISLDDGRDHLLAGQKFLFFNVDGSMVPQEIKGYDKMGDGFIYSFKRIPNKEVASNYVDQPIFIVKEEGMEEVVDPEPLVGWTLKDIATENQLSIEAVEEYPQQVMLLCRTNEDRKVLIPFVEEWIEEVNEEKTLIIFKLPEGIL